MFLLHVFLEKRIDHHWNERKLTRAGFLSGDKDKGDRDKGKLLLPTLFQASQESEAVSV
jgi:hypothetical protein